MVYIHRCVHGACPAPVRLCRRHVFASCFQNRSANVCRANRTNWAGFGPVTQLVQFESDQVGFNSMGIAGACQVPQDYLGKYPGRSDFTERKLGALRPGTHVISFDLRIFTPPLTVHWQSGVTPTPAWPAPLPRRALALQLTFGITAKLGPLLRPSTSR